MDPSLLIVFFICIVGIIYVVAFVMLARTYVKVPPDRALVRTGGAFRKPGMPPKVVMNGGSWVFGMVHEITWVDLRSVPIEVNRTGQNALLTRDAQAVDVEAVFYIKVAPVVEGIADAARTIGGKTVDAEAIKQLVSPKLNSALRDVVAAFTLEALPRENEEFTREVQKHARGDLEENGLVLESLSIVTLGPSRPDSIGTSKVTDVL
jgi:flotillin